MDAGQQLAADLLEAQKRRDQATVDALRQIKSAYHNAEIAALGPLDSVAAIKFFQQQLKQREEAAAVFKQANRPELAAKEEVEAKIIRNYLPSHLTSEQLDVIVREAVAEAGAQGFGGAMKIAVAKVAGGATGQEIAAAIKKIL
jgi:uncharacterized protein YqeY